MNNLKQLNQLGQSVWLDSIERTLISSGELKWLITEEGISGITSNPSIFEKAIGKTDHYNDEISALVKKGTGNSKLLYEALAIRDIQEAADLFRPTYERTAGKDGFVSLEVSPQLAHNQEETILEALRLWKLIGRENTMIKVPGTKECIPAIRKLIAQGVNINITLLFSVETYEKVLEAYVCGLEDLRASGGDVKKVTSVASIFVSRLDTAVDKLILQKQKEQTDAGKKKELEFLLGKVAISNAKMAYQKYLKFHDSDRWKKLSALGAKPQKLLWASTSTKNPSYPELQYVEELIGENTVNTIPPQTLATFSDHGRVRASLTEDLPTAENVIATLKNFGISLQEVTDSLLRDGLAAFSDSFDKLLSAVSAKRKASLGDLLNSQTMKLPEDLRLKVEATLEQWKAQEKMQMLWRGDASLWTDKTESEWMGWLSLPQDSMQRISFFENFAEEIKTAGFTDVLLLGMGGSSLCPEVISKIFKQIPGSPQLHILDSTDPVQIREIEEKINLSSSLFVVSSKSGSTLEPNIFFEYFFEKISKELGEQNSGNRFVAITDPGSPLESLAQEKHFRAVFHGKPSVGGRYSALSDFGMVPAALMGIKMKPFLESVLLMVDSCDADLPVAKNPGALLGLTLAEAALLGKNKITFICSPRIENFGTWLEQLLAESTGKEGKGLIPIAGEMISSPEFYNQDRLFVHLKVKDDKDDKTEKYLQELQQAGHPIVEILMKDIYSIGQEFFRWEMATAVAGSVLGINPFDQPDVEASKNIARELTDKYEKTGTLKSEKPNYEEDGIQVFFGENSPDLEKSYSSLADVMKQEFNGIKAGDYFGILAYIPMKPAFKEEMEKMRLTVRDGKKVATCLEFGPRFLHSTGQIYKGGPNSGVFLEITTDHEKDLEIPNHRSTFGIVELAQAQGDFQILTSQKKRRALRVHFKKDIATNLAKLSTAVENALS